jgi:hypothetical protein
MRQERRLHHRYPVVWQLKGRVLRAIETNRDILRPAIRDVLGAVSNLGAGGMCVLTDDHAEVSLAVGFDVDVSSPLRCEIIVPDIPVGIPTLLQIRWVRRIGDGRTRELGLQFLV